MNICDLALVIKNHLNDDECQQLIKEYERKRITATPERSLNSYTEKVAQSTFKRVTVKETNRHYELVRSKTESALSIWLEYLQNKNMFSVGVLRDSLRHTYDDFRILKYEVGTFIHPHTDWEHFNHASVSLNLNDEYTGGEFVFMSGERIVSLGKGDALVFPADPYWVHETKPILSGTRYTINSFISSVNPSVQKKLISESYNSWKEHDRIFKL